MKKIVNIRPLFIIAVIFMLGIIITVGSFIASMPLLMLIPACGFAFAILISVVKRRKNILRLVCGLACVFILASLLTVIDVLAYKKCSEFSDGVCYISGKVCSEQVYGGNEYAYVVTDVKINGEAIECNLRFNDKNCDLSVGDLIRFSSELEIVDLKSFVADSDKVALKTKNVVSVERYGSELSFYNKLNLKIKTLTFDNFGENSGFVFGLLTGETGYIETNELENLRYSGIAHIFAVSGLHIGFLIVLLRIVCDFLNIKRLWRALIIFIITFAYSGICGFSVSSVRAVIMSSVYLIARARGDKYDIINSWSLALLIVLTLNRLDVFTAGFILSFACVFSIALFYKTFEDWLIAIKNEKLRQAFATGLSVQLGVTPLACFLFGYTSALSLLLNIIIIPIIAINYGALIIFTTVSLIIPQLAVLLVWSSYLVRFFADMFSLFSFARWTSFIELTPLAVAIYYAIAIFASDRLNVHNRIKLGACICSVCFLLIFTI